MEPILRLRITLRDQLPAGSIELGYTWDFHEAGMISRYRRLFPHSLTGHLSLGHELALVVALKIVALVILYYLFFSPAHRPATDTAAHLIGPIEFNQTPHSPGR